MMQAKTIVLSALAGGLLALTGCQSNEGSIHDVPASDFYATPLDRYQIGVKEHREYLEVKLDPRDTQLRATEVMKVRAFIDKYADAGHGPLVISMPKQAEAPQLAVGAVSEIRELAWEAGVSYDQLDDFLEGKSIDPEAAERILDIYRKTQHKRQPIPTVYD